jgi:radical SAM superfamily enzyme YgiQ (UPF0313 family)
MNLAYLAAYLREYGIQVRIIDYETTVFDVRSFSRILEQGSFSILGVSCTTPTIASGSRICAIAKSRCPEIVTVVGGSHANALPEQTLEQFPPFDYLVFGEGEETLFELCRAIRDGKTPTHIDGLAFRTRETITKNPARKLIKDLDTIPFPARDLIDNRSRFGHSTRGFLNRTPSTELYTSRGCPYSCNFCAIQTTFGKRVRFRGSDSIEEEVRLIKNELRLKHIIVADDTFTLNENHAFEICDIFRRNGVESWSCDTRADHITQELLKAMKLSGCQKIAFGVESGSQRILDLNGKGLTTEQVASAVHWAREAGIRYIEGNFIIGSHPAETMDDIQQTRRLLRSLPWSFVSIAVITPYPGTMVYDLMKEQGLLHKNIQWEDFMMFGATPRWETIHFSAKDLLNLQKKLTREFYLRPDYIMKRLLSVKSWQDAFFWISSGGAYLKWYVKSR